MENKMINFILRIKSRETLHPGEFKFSLTSDKKQENYEGFFSSKPKFSQYSERDIIKNNENVIKGPTLVKRMK